MVGEKDMIPALEKQFLEFLNFIDSCGLSQKSKMEIYSRFQKVITEKIISDSINYGRKLETKKHENKNNNNNNNNGFSEFEESLINQHIRYFKEHGVDAPVKFLYPPTEKDFRLIEEARRRIKEEIKSI